MNHFKCPSYIQFTDFHLEPAGRLRLDRIVSEIVTEFPPTDPARIQILEIGCGTGNISRALASYGYSVTGIDLDPLSISTAQNSNPFKNLTFDAIRLEQLSDREQFNVVICSEVIEHLSQPKKFLQEIHNVLLPGGILLITVPNGYGPEELLRRFLVTTVLGKKIKRAISGMIRSNNTVQTHNFESPHIQYFTLGSLSQLIRTSGYNIVKVSNWTVFFMQLYYMFLRLFLKRDGETFRFLDTLDYKLSHRWPINLGGGWFVAATRAIDQARN